MTGDARREPREGLEYVVSLDTREDGWQGYGEHDPDVIPKGFVESVPLYRLASSAGYEIVPVGERLVIVCDRCGRTLTGPGALVFGPPLTGPGDPPLAAKYHLCVRCFTGLVPWLEDQE